MLRRVEKEQQVLNAAKAVFLRHGFRRVTMQDLADEAGISRPALYLLYPNKEEVFKAAARAISSELISMIREQLPQHKTVYDKLKLAFEMWNVYPFELMLSSPNSRDLIECGQGFARDTVREASVEFEALLIEIMMPLAAQAELAGFSLSETAHLFEVSGHGLKDAASSVEELRGMIDLLLRLTLAALG